LSRVIILYSKSDILYIVAFGPQIIQVAICLTWYQSPGLEFRTITTSVLQFINFGLSIFFCSFAFLQMQCYCIRFAFERGVKEY
jgi:hypothetical protein